MRAEFERCRAGGPDIAAVRASDLVKEFGGGSKKFKAVDGLCISMPHDQIFALLGHNGAGKTTAIKMMSGMTGMTAGSVDVAGYSVSHQTSKVC